MSDERRLMMEYMSINLMVYCAKRMLVGCNDCPLVDMDGCYNGVSYEKLKRNYEIIFGKLE